MALHTDEVDKHITQVMSQITEAAAKQDLVGIQRLARKAAELGALKEQIATIQHRIASLTSEEVINPPAGGDQQSNGKLREFPIEVTDGDKRQYLLKLTPHIRRGKIKPGEEMLIEAIPSGEQFHTEVLEKGNKLRARGEIARFYKDANVKGGDFVLLTEVAPGRWTLKKAPPGQYKSRMAAMLEEYG